MIAAMIGSAMIASTIIAVNMPLPVADGVPKSGMKPSTSCSAGSIVERRKGPRTMIPQRPMMTLGTAASISTSGPITAAVLRPLIKLRYRPIAIPSGAAKQQRASARHKRAVDQRPGAEDGVVVPGSVEEKAEPVLGDRGARGVDDLVDDQPDEGDRTERCERGEDEQRPIA